MATADEHRTIAPIVGPDDPRRFTDSGIEIKPPYDDAGPAAGPAETARRARRVPVHARHPPRHVPRAAVDDAPVRGLRERDRSPTSATATCSSQGSTGLSMAFDLPTQLGLDSDDPRCLGRGRADRGGDRHDRRHADRVRSDPARPGVDLDDDQRAGERAAAALRARRRGAGRAVAEQLRGTTQNDILKEYIARGNYIYPPTGAIRLTTDLFAYCHERIPTLEHDLDQRLPLPREGLLGRAGGRVHARQRDRLRPGGARRRARDRQSSRRGWRSSSTATTTSSRRWPSSAPRGGCGPRSCASASAPRTSARGGCASTPRPAASR